jgi:hypothetical protein
VGVSKEIYNWAKNKKFKIYRSSFDLKKILVPDNYRNFLVSLSNVSFDLENRKNSRSVIFNSPVRVGVVEWLVFFVSLFIVFFDYSMVRVLYRFNSEMIGIFMFFFYFILIFFFLFFFFFTGFGVVTPSQLERVKTSYVGGRNCGMNVMEYAFILRLPVAH